MSVVAFNKVASGALVLGTGKVSALLVSTVAAENVSANAVAVH